MPNTTNATICNLTVANLLSATQMRFGVYRVLTLIYLVISISTNVILLLAFYKQSKTEKAYGYQVLFTISKTLETYAFGTYLLAGKWFYSQKLEWFVGNYMLVFIFIKLGVCLHVTFIISSLLLSIAMAADRVLALHKPIVYKNINHSKHQGIASICCFALGFLGGAMYFFDEQISFNGTRYVATFDQDLEHTILGQIFFYYRLIARVGGIILLVLLNVIMIIVFRKRMREAGKVSTSRTKEERKTVDKMLLWINIYQACMMLVNQLPHITWQVFLNALPKSFESCEGQLIGPICDGMLMITDTLDFFIVMSINGRMHKLVVNALPNWFCKNNSVHTIVN